MPPERSQQLVDEVRVWYQTHSMRQKDLAAVLGLSPQGLNEIFAKRNRPTAEVALRMLEFLQTNMKPQLVDPPHTQPIASRDDEPKTLLAAKERIAELTTQLKTQTGGAPKPLQQPTAPKSQPFDPSADPGFRRVQSPPPSPLKSLPTSADTPFKITEILKMTNLNDLLSMLSNASHTPLQQGMIYSEVKLRRSLTAGG